MSVEVMSAVLKCGPEEQTPMLVLLMIADNADDFGFACPSHDTIASKARCDKRTVMRQIDALVRDQWLGVVHKAVNGRGNAYFINTAKLGVTVSPKSALSPLHMAIRKSHGDKLSRIFSPSSLVTEGARDGSVEVAVTPAQSSGKAVETPFLPAISGDTEVLSGDVPQPAQVTSAETQVTNCPVSGDTRCHTNHQEPPVQPPVSEPSTEENNPLPPAGVDSGADFDRFQRFKTALKLELTSQPSHPNFKPVVPEQDDFDACFRDWWLDEALYEHNELRLMTRAREPARVVLGNEKYAARIQRLLRKYFSPNGRYAIAVNVQSEKQAAAA